MEEKKHPIAGHITDAVKKAARDAARGIGEQHLPAGQHTKPVDTHGAPHAPAQKKDTTILGTGF
jgi:hypothetical protein